ncbi:hypothetical protein FTZ84_20445 [Salmonella enterica]|nr:hypothetical protein [Salmonella enterica]EDT7230367.1 hypothetical protein [Salmonella enterica subsp. enterica]EHD8092524.1 hypothetical protein [Salmonella enterica]
MMNSNYDSLIYNHYKDRVILMHSLYEGAKVLYCANMLKSALKAFRFALNESEDLLVPLDSNDRLLYLKIKDLIVLIEQYIVRCEDDMRANVCR